MAKNKSTITIDENLKGFIDPGHSGCFMFTDGWNIYYDYIAAEDPSRSSLRDLAFGLAHELTHVWLDHVTLLQDMSKGLLAAGHDRKIATLSAKLSIEPSANLLPTQLRLSSDYPVVDERCLTKKFGDRINPRDAAPKLARDLARVLKDYDSTRESYENKEKSGYIPVPVAVLSAGWEGRIAEAKSAVVSLAPYLAPLISSDGVSGDYVRIYGCLIFYIRPKKSVIVLQCDGDETEQQPSQEDDDKSGPSGCVSGQGDSAGSPDGVGEEGEQDGSDQSDSTGEGSESDGGGNEDQQQSSGGGDLKDLQSAIDGLKSRLKEQSQEEISDDRIREIIRHYQRQQTTSYDRTSDILPVEIKDNSKPDDAIQEDIRSQCDQILIEYYNKYPGNVPGDFVDMIKFRKRNRPRSLLNWIKSRVGRAIQGRGFYTWAKPNFRRRLIPDIIYPDNVRKRAKIIIVVDSSGSMCGKPIQHALGEAKAVLDSPRYDAEIIAYDHGLQEIDIQFNHAKVTGFGGTDMSAPIKEAEPKLRRCELDALLVITDGYTPWPEHPVPNVFAIVVDPVAPKPPAWIKTFQYDADVV